MVLILNITFSALILSLLSTVIAILIGLTQKVWKKRDGILFFNIFLVDILFSCSMLALCARMLTSKGGGRTASHVFVFTYLLSWGCQCIITINRYTMVSYPFGYKAILPRSRLCIITACLFTVTYGTMFASLGLSDTREPCIPGNMSTCSISILICDVILPQFSNSFLSVIVAFHIKLVIAVYAIECWLWKTAKRHRHHFHSLTSSINKKEPREGSPPEGREFRRDSITQSIRRKLSLSHQRPPVNVHGTPVFYLAAHLLTLVSYLVIGVIYISPANMLSTYKDCRNMCMLVQLLVSIRPIINLGNHLSTKSLKRFTKLIQKLIQRDSRELFTEYYYENEADKMRKRRKEEIKLRPRIRNQ